MMIIPTAVFFLDPVGRVGDLFWAGARGGGVELAWIFDVFEDF